MEKSGTWLQLILKNMSLVFFVAFLGVMYIANAHFAERKQLKIEKLKKDVQRLKWEYTGIEQKILLNSSPSELEKKMKEEGLKHSAKVPKKLTLDQEDEN